MERSFTIMALVACATTVMAGDTYRTTGVDGTLLHNALTGEITKLDDRQGRGLGRPLWSMMGGELFFVNPENELHLDCADMMMNAAVQAVGFTLYNNCTSDQSLYISFYESENNHNSQTRHWLGGFYIENIPGSVAEGHPPDEYWSWNWRSWLPDSSYIFDGADLDTDGLQDFGYFFWIVSNPDGLAGPGFGFDPDGTYPLGAGAEDGWDVFADPNFQFDPNLLGIPPSNTTYLGYFDFGGSLLSQFDFEMYAPACQLPGDAGRYCSADIHGYDCYVDLSDLAQLLANYGMTTGATVLDGDIEPYDEFSPGDGDVDLADLAEMLGQYGDDCNE